MMQPPEKVEFVTASGSARISTFPILPHARQHCERPDQRFRHHRLIDPRLGIARKARERQGEFLRDRLTDIDRIAIKGLECWFVAGERDFLSLLRSRAVNQRETIGNRAANRFERNRAALLELRRKFGFQKDHLEALPPEFYFGHEAVKGYEVEPPGEPFPFLHG